MDWFYTVWAYAGLVWVLWKARHYLLPDRVVPTGSPDEGVPKGIPAPLVSIIVPARNEAKALPELLASLGGLNYPNYEIIVVDDQSSDGTGEVARRYPVQMREAPPKPAGWVGKNWACHHGAGAARGSLLLFTDADTIHLPGSLSQAVARMKATGTSLLSAPSYHRNRLWWEKLLAPFYFLISVSASPYETKRPGNAYAVGQYLLINARFYHRIGGHAAMKSSLAEDVDLARRTLAEGGAFLMHTATRLYEVQMFNDFSEFAAGWVRLLRLGIRYLSPVAILTSLLTLCTLASLHLNQLDFAHWFPTLLALACVGRAQRRLGDFPLWGLIFYPFPVLLFMLLATRAALGQALKQPLAWRGRTYRQPSPTAVSP